MIRYVILFSVLFLALLEYYSLRVDLRRVKLTDYAVVIGSEGRGVCREFLEAARTKLIIPMRENCESLNAAVAATVVLWELRRKL